MTHTIEQLELEIAAWRQSSDLKAEEIKRLRAALRQSDHLYRLGKHYEAQMTVRRALEN